MCFIHDQQDMVIFWFTRGYQVLPLQTSGNRGFQMRFDSGWGNVVGEM